MKKELMSIVKYIVPDLCVAGLVVFIFASIQGVRQLRTMRIWRNLESGAIQSEEYCIDQGIRFRMHTHALGLLGYSIFGDETYIIHSNGRRQKFVCSDFSGRVRPSLPRYLRRVERGEFGKRYGSFDEWLRDDRLFRSFSGWKSPEALLWCDAFFSMFFASAVATVRRLVARRRKDCKCSSFWVYYLVVVCVLIGLYLVYRIMNSGVIGFARDDMRKNIVEYVAVRRIA